MKISTRIREIRKERGFTQSDLGKRIGVSQPTVSDWEKGVTEPTVDNLRLLAVELGVYFEWIVTGRGERDFKHEVRQEGESYRVEIPIPDDETELISLYRKINSGKKEALLRFLRSWIG